MDRQKFGQYLQDFGLTRQEAAVYGSLMEKGRQTGYEIAMETGISRSNAYGSLAALVEKGAAYRIEDTATRYIPVPLQEFCGNRIRRMQEESDWLVRCRPQKQQEEDGYITIEGARNILDKIRNLLAAAQERVYISCTSKMLGRFEPELGQLAKEGKKVVIITDAPVSMEGVTVYTGADRGRQIGVITDSCYALSGEYGEESMNTCLYSGQKNFVTLFKTALANEIQLIVLTKKGRDR